MAIKVVGIGGGGISAVNRMIEDGVADVEFIAINTDAQALLLSDADIKLDIGGELVRGLGAGANPELGRTVAELHRGDIEEVLSGSELVFVACGEGGGTGTGGAPVVASVARRLGALTIGVVTRPFSFEGRRRGEQADEGIEALTAACDAVMVIPNDRLLSLSGHRASIADGFRLADQVLVNAVRGLTDLITTPGLISIGYGAVRQMLTGAGPAVIAIGEASGPRRAARSAAAAISSQLTEQNLLAARGVIISVAGSSGLRYEEVQEVVVLVTGEADQDANVIFGAVLDDSLGDSLRTTVVAVGPPPEREAELLQQQMA
ncbi:cell division protein FtsZ [Kitasatospora sp. NBC_00070]